MAWTDGVNRATLDLITAADWNTYVGASGSLQQLKSHAHGGTTGEGSQSLGALVLADFTTAAAPAAPGAAKGRYYVVTSDRPGFRSGAAGAAETLATLETAATFTAIQTFSAQPVFSAATGISFSAAVARIIPGVTSLSLRNNANNADNLILTDAGAATFRSTVGGITTLTATTLAGTLSTAAQPSVTSLGTLAANLIFTDNLYDIGASGATRPRNLFLAGTATIGGFTDIT